MINWLPISTAPRDGTHVWGLRNEQRRRTWFGKTSHVPLYGWCYLSIPGDVENCDLWEPTHWQPLGKKEPLTSGEDNG